MAFVEEWLFVQRLIVYLDSPAIITSPRLRMRVTRITLQCRMLLLFLCFCFSAFPLCSFCQSQNAAYLCTLATGSIETTPCESLADF